MAQYDPKKICRPATAREEISTTSEQNVPYKLYSHKQKHLVEILGCLENESKPKDFNKN